jgi:hypothetical protein
MHYHYMFPADRADIPSCCGHMWPLFWSRDVALSLWTFLRALFYEKSTCQPYLYVLYYLTSVHWLHTSEVWPSSSTGCTLSLCNCSVHWTAVLPLLLIQSTYIYDMPLALYLLTQPVSITENALLCSVSKVHVSIYLTVVYVTTFASQLENLDSLLVWLCLHTHQRIHVFSKCTFLSDVSFSLGMYNSWKFEVSSLNIWQILYKRK